MINTSRLVVYGVVNKLNELGLPVYVDSVKSNLRYPCFIVKPIEYLYKKYPNNRHMTTIPIQIVYIPDGKRGGSNLDISDKFTELHDLLDVIDIGEGYSIRGYNMGSETFDNLLYYKVDYRVMLQDKVIDKLMSELEVKY